MLFVRKNYIACISFTVNVALRPYAIHFAGCLLKFRLPKLQCFC